MRKITEERLATVRRTQAFADAHPTLKTREIADRLGMKPQAVWWIVNPRQFAAREFARICSREDCSVHFSTTNKKTRQCVDHRSVKGGRFIQLTCHTCGIEFPRRATWVTAPSLKRNPFRRKPQELYFHNRVCYGVWLGNNHGFGVYPDHQRHRVRATA